MKTLSREEMKRNVNKVFDMLKTGEEIVITGDSDRENIAVIRPVRQHTTRKKRQLGLLKGKASCIIKDDFAISDEEFISS